MKRSGRKDKGSLDGKPGDERVFFQREGDVVERSVSLREGVYTPSSGDPVRDNPITTLSIF